MYRIISRNANNEAPYNPTLRIFNFHYSAELLDEKKWKKKKSIPRILLLWR